MHCVISMTTRRQSDCLRILAKDLWLGCCQAIRQGVGLNAHAKDSAMTQIRHLRLSAQSMGKRCRTWRNVYGTGRCQRQRDRHIPELSKIPRVCKDVSAGAGVSGQRFNQSRRSDRLVHRPGADRLKRVIVLNL